jgi:8-oxo-dGTP pyrophosphatase MutT (NUDIX family)
MPPAYRARAAAGRPQRDVRNSFTNLLYIFRAIESLEELGAIDRPAKIHHDEKRLARQVAALPWRLAGSGIEVLLVTSRETKRWVVPKGWPMQRRTAAQSAAREAFEEAGILGSVAARNIGEYTYHKRLTKGSDLDCRVELFALRVTRQQTDFPEKGQRVARWFHPSEAAKLVAEPKLAELIRAFAAGGFMRAA